jgi:hypothetical protein
MFVIKWSVLIMLIGTAHFKNVIYWLDANIYSYLETSGGESSNLYLNVVHFIQHQCLLDIGCNLTQL